MTLNRVKRWSFSVVCMICYFRTDLGQTDAFDDLQPKMEIIKKAHIYGLS